MIKTNIVILKDLDQKKTLFEIIFEKQIYSNKLNEYIRKLRNLNKDVVSFINWNRIIVDNKKVISTLKDIHKSDNFKIDEKVIELKSPDNLLKRYIGEAISQQLRNRFEKLVITNQGKDWFKAVDYDKKVSYGQIQLFKGFRFKIILLKDQIGIIIDPKSKFYTEFTLREIYDDGEDINGRYLEKLCPIIDCDQKFNPFAMCKHGNPESFGVMGIDNFFKDRSPEEEDLIEHYSTNGCEKGLLGKKLKDTKPVIAHYYWSSNKSYSFPLEILRKSPKFDDAGDEASNLADEVVMNPDERFYRIEDYLEYFETLKEEKFPILLSEPLEIGSEYFESKYFEKPTYLINNVKIKENPYNQIQNGDIIRERRKIKLFVLLPHSVKDLINNIKKYFKDFEQWYNCRLYFKFINLENTNLDELDIENEKNSLFLILKEDPEENYALLSFLVKNLCRIHEIHLSTLTNEELFKKENIYSAIYHKLFPPFFLLDGTDKYKKIVGLIVQSYGQDKIIAILQFDYDGVFKKGIYIKESDNGLLNERVKNFLNLINKNENLILINGILNRSLKDYFNTQNFKYVYLSDNSLVRFFRFSYNEPSRTGIPVGNGINFNNKWYIVSYASRQGTQKSIKIKNSSLSESEFKVVAQICFEQTKFHPGFSQNSMKLPFPIHFGRKTLKKLKRLDFKELNLNYPIYL